MILEIQKIIDAIQVNRIRISDHADEEAQVDRLKFDEIYFSVFNGEIIEDYLNDEPYPDCLIYGKTLICQFGAQSQASCFFL